MRISEWSSDVCSSDLWFALHMFMGIFGPVLVLLHSTLRLHSLNATVAFWSMVIVASSGVVGRFVYGRLHAGLYGRQRSFADVAKAAETTPNNATARLTPAPAVMTDLHGFDAPTHQLAPDGVARH